MHSSASLDPARVSEVVELLRGRGLRMTPQRRAIVAEVMRAQGHISPQALARQIQNEMPGVDTSTVYRTLSLLEEVGVLQHSHMESGLEYHRSEDAAHVHLTCSRCGADHALSFESLEEFRRLIREQHGFEADLAHTEINGLCRACARDSA
jgi:Fur family ferric uptake transcriptional regulator